jgi:endonuclease-8
VADASGGSGGGAGAQQQVSEIGGRLVGRAVTALYVRGVAHAALVGEVITSVEAHGQRLLIGVGALIRLHLHPGPHARLRLVPRTALSLAAAAKATLVIATDDMAVIWSGARAVEVLQLEAGDTGAERGAAATLGPDLLDPEFAMDEAIARARARPADTPVGELLLDPRVAAGIGNVHKNETLFLERVDPWTPLGRLDDAALAALFGRARALVQGELAAAAQAPELAAGRAGWVRPSRPRLNVHRRRGRPCRVCGTEIGAGAQGTPPRSTYFCPRCQGRAT